MARMWNRMWMGLRLLSAVAALAALAGMPQLPGRAPAVNAAAADRRSPVPRPKVAPAASARSPAVTSTLALDRTLAHGEYAWADEGVPPGPLWIVVDLKAQYIHVIRGGSEIGRAVILYGADNKPTPVGTFRITQKDADHVSNLYDVPMPYMLRLTDDGIAIHASTVEYGSATHGCIGVPDEFAATLFAHARLGDRVLITDGGGGAGDPLAA